MAAKPRQTIWKKRMLFPFWTIRILLMIFVMVIYILAFLKLKKDDDPDFHYEENKKGYIAVFVVFELVCFIVILLDVLTILMYLKGNLRPAVFVGIGSLQTAFWAVILVIDIIAAIRKDKNVKRGIPFTVSAFIIFLNFLIYGVTVLLKERVMRKKGHHSVPAYDVRHSYDAGAGYAHPPGATLPNVPKSDNHQESGYYTEADTPLVVKPQSQGGMMQSGSLKPAHVV
ncbi:hypothetical protein P154DRAFT_561127 [Amniculicola lignicola CBS 123094]|uniref:MARVEL domain-containing protein n=1 Tax=Amniculicola lignicola CBS 123094 TaxID=1392246 RepID=A0A6A5WRW2_9PLEO|nr:hypothetical protein P154DRAFT_561127 [Amniculicola lignicola CBS 123094]